MASRNPFDDDESYMIIEDKSKITRNPFEESSRETDNDDNNDDDDDQSFLSVESEEAKLNNVSSKPNPRTVIHGDKAISTIQHDLQHSSTAETRKRKAPLSFHFDPVEETPALSFHSTLPSSEDVNVNTKPALDFDDARIYHSSQGNDFVSPLEIALVQVENLKSPHESNEEINDDKKEDANNSSYFSIAWLSNFLLSPTNTLFTKDKGHKNDDSKSEDNFKLTHEKNFANGDPEAKPLLESHDSEVRMEKYESFCHNNNNETNPLLEAQDVKARMARLSKNVSDAIEYRYEKKISSKKRHAERLLTRIDNNPSDEEHVFVHGLPGMPWSRLIILEELGTASSWVLLLLPYIAFVLALVIDSGSLWRHTSDALMTDQMCPGSLKSTTVPLMPLPNNPCWYNYNLVPGYGLLSFIDEKGLNNKSSFETLVHSGVAVTTGMLTNVSPLSSYIYADIAFESISTESVRMVAQGDVFFSSLVMQQRIGNSKSENQWYPVSISQPTRLKMICSHDKLNSKWNCRSHKTVDILFTLPLSSVLTGGPIRIDTIFSYHNDSTSVEKNPDISHSKFHSMVTISPADDNDILSNDFQVSDHSEGLLEIAQSSSIYVSHEKYIQAEILTAVRIMTLIVSIAFFVFWLWSMGIDGFLGLKADAPSSNVSKVSNPSLFDNPWFVLPERRYLLIMMIALIAFENPIMVYMYFRPSSLENLSMHILADSLTGVAIHAILCLWLCLLQGLKYHTAEMTKKRQDHLKRQLELQRSIRFLQTSENNEYYNSAKPLSDNMFSYYDEHGDPDFASLSILRMKHDPCGDNWLDFLLPKIFLFIIGSISIFVTSYFDYLDGSLVGISTLHQYQRFYASSSMLQMLTILLWVILIIRAVIGTGKTLREQPFLSTRPAQLVYRISLNMIILAATSIIIISFADVRTYCKNLDFGQHFIDSKHFLSIDNSFAIFDKLFHVALHLQQRIPYISTSGLGAGEILFVTVCTLCICFIFLPSTEFILNLDHHAVEKSESDGTIQKESQKRDKRNLVRMASNTHTWRIFPSPIDRDGKILQKRQKLVEHYEVDKNMHITANEWGPGTIYRNNYTPVFCIETALWLLECSWQTYYSATEYKTDDFAPGKMNLNSVGLKLEVDIFDEDTDTRAFVATNMHPQIDGETDSIVVIAFRGTASSTNIKTDLNWNQEPLSNSFINGSQLKAEFQIKVQNSSDKEYGTCPTFTMVQNETAEGIKTSGAEKILKTVPITRQAFPCIHSGFQYAYFKVRDEIINSVLKVYQRQLGKALERCSENSSPLKLPKIYLTGHSLGGALSQLLALDLATNVEICNINMKKENIGHKRSYSGVRSMREESILTRQRSNTCPPKRVEMKDNQTTDFIHEMLSGLKFDHHSENRSLRLPIAVYSFGQPRVGNRSFAKFYKLHVPHTFRVVAEDDLVTAFPLAWGFSLYKHAGLEVALEEGCTGNILVGPTVVETLFRFSKMRTSLNAHLMDNYRKCVESALTSSELQEFYRYRCSGDHSFRGGYNTSDVIPDWVTDVSNDKKNRKSVTLPSDWISESERVENFGHLPEWAR